MYSSILNTEWDSNFELSTSDAFMNCKKINKCMVINSVMDICIFQVSVTVWICKDFSRLFHTYDHFQGFSRPLKFLY